jgi:hypothetical protein
MFLSYDGLKFSHDPVMIDWLIDWFLCFRDLNSGPTPWATPPDLLSDGYFRGRVLTICPGWLQTTILLVSTSWVARIIGVSHQYPADPVF